MANSVKKIRYFYKNLLISFVFFSLYVCKPLRRTLSIIDYANLFAASISISQWFRANLSWCTKRTIFYFSQKRKDLDGYKKAISSGATWKQKIFFNLIREKNNASIFCGKQQQKDTLSENFGNKTFAFCYSFLYFWRQHVKPVAIFWPLYNLVYSHHYG